MKRKNDCIFCRIASGDMPSFRVCEDDLTLTFMDLFPVAPGHALVITREHFSDIFEANPEALAAVAATSLRMAHAIEQVLAPDGLGIFQLNRPAAGQTVFHYHMHLIPRNTGEAFSLHSRVRGDDDQLRSMAERIAAALN
jgi:histidine triad (HIT) family protein